MNHDTSEGKSPVEFLRLESDVGFWFSSCVIKLNTTFPGTFDGRLRSVRQLFSGAGILLIRESSHPLRCAQSNIVHQCAHFVGQSSLSDAMIFKWSECVGIFRECHSYLPRCMYHVRIVERNGDVNAGTPRTRNRFMTFHSPLPTLNSQSSTTDSRLSTSNRTRCPRRIPWRCVTA